MSLLSTDPRLADVLGLFTDDLGVEVTERDVDTDLDELHGWDSVNLLRLIMLVEQATGRRLALPAFLEARTIRRIHALLGPDGGAEGQR
ncbi:acyl carrier protein [Streptomyces beihaiensis]|uniref:Acyl carrier protein n=1 Tax=Streptomyces beihaiensis TaxID=2984495 RepID=A0ABT3TY07_9ACTN|nr:acyl carrier protein [Streptomyces beihaiensis]MCX3061381.1 acyl carrier protein [Streptomyces beihaiensis]